MTDVSEKKLRVIIIGIGSQPEEKLPIHKELGLRDWDDPPGAIEWERMANELLYIKTNGRTSDSHYSHDHLNPQKPVDVDQATVERWKNRFIEIQTRFIQRGEDVVWVVVDGFLLYWDLRIYSQLSVKAFLRVPQSVAKARREERQYYTAAAALEGGYWLDPPNYWDGIVWPAFKKAHAALFADGDAENGTTLSEKIPDLLVLSGTETSMDQLLGQMCQGVIEFAEKELA
ncbi:ribosylnicotinamide kinase [Tulasnella sp. 427]|nr:ribosylnicotinamide kinase [Tulasnella sp. 427]